MSADGAGALRDEKPVCTDVVEHIYEYVDGEVTPQALQAVREHLLTCPPCLEQYEVQVALKALVRRCCQDRAPESLRVRILARITESRTGQTPGSQDPVTQAPVTRNAVTEARVTEVRLVRE